MMADILSDDEELPACGVCFNAYDEGVMPESQIITGETENATPAPANRSIVTTNVTEFDIKWTKAQILTKAQNMTIEAYIKAKITIKNARGGKFTFTDINNPSAIQDLYDSHEAIEEELKELIRKKLKAKEFDQQKIMNENCKITVEFIKKKISIKKNRAIAEDKIIELKKKETKIAEEIEKNEARSRELDILLNLMQSGAEIVRAIRGEITAIETLNQLREQTVAHDIVLNLMQSGAEIIRAIGGKITAIETLDQLREQTVAHDIVLNLLQSGAEIIRAI